MIVKLLRVTPEPEEIIEYAARVCYDSQDKMNGKLIPTLIKSGHESPLEHACATFELRNVSRALTHQLVRHRLMSVSQKSQRYVNEENFGYVIPDSLSSADDIFEYSDDMDYIKTLYTKWKNRGIRKEDARMFLPNGCYTTIIITANFREFRHIFKVRCSKHAQWEIRQACNIMKGRLYAEAPNVFGDLMEENEK